MKAIYYVPLGYSSRLVKETTKWTHTQFSARSKLKNGRSTHARRGFRRDEGLPESSDGSRFVFSSQRRNVGPSSRVSHNTSSATPPPVKPDEWPHRELKMYRSFRERILRLCPKLYDDLCPLEILSLMRRCAFPPESSTLQSVRLSLRISLYITRQTTTAIWVVDRRYSSILSRFVAAFRSMPVRRTSPPTPRPASTNGAEQSCDHWGFIRASPRGAVAF